jgi:hypothetical protein
LRLLQCESLGSSVKLTSCRDTSKFQSLPAAFDNSPPGNRDFKERERERDRQRKRYKRERERYRRREREKEREREGEREKDRER